jgi:hypothetical protein
MNPLRQNMTRDAVAKARDGNLEITVRNVAMFLPGPTAFDPALKKQPDFALDADDIAPYLPLAAEPLIVEPSTEIVDAKTVEVQQPVESPQARIARLETATIKLERERQDLRYAREQAVIDERAAQLELEKIARAFMSGFSPPITPDQLLRQHVQQQAEQRRLRAEGKVPGPRARTVGPSTLDRYAAAQRGGSPGFAGRGYSRGGLPATKRQMTFPTTPQAAGQPGGPLLQNFASER